MMKAWHLSLILLVGSLLITIVMWLMHLPFFFLFLFVPLIPFFSRERRVKQCPVCGWETTGSENFCPFDATPLSALRDEIKEVEH